MASRIAATLLLCLLSSTALGEDWVKLEDRFTAEQKRATGLDTLSPQQLAALNALLSDAATADDQRDAQATAAAETRLREEARADAEAQVRAELAAAPAADPDRMIAHSEGPVTARVKGVVAGWKPGDEFRLDNGQVWKVLKGQMNLPKPRQDPQISVVPGFAGRWFLEVDPDLPKARVYRID